MAKNTIIMIGDGLGWEMTRAAAVYKQIQEGKTGASLSDFYTAGKGTGLNMQTLTGYTFATTYGTTIPDANGVYNTSQAAVTGPSSAATGVNPPTTGFVFNPTFNPGTTPTGGAKVSDGVVGNLVGYDPVRGGINPWTPGTNKEYIKLSYPDSANTATTLYTGVKSYNNAIGVDIFEENLEGALAKAAAQGKSTGLVTSVPIDHATPAAAAANVNRRNKYDGDFPALDNILQQELRIYQPTVILGGGHPLSALGDQLPLPVGVEPFRDNTYIKESTYKEFSTKPNDNLYDYTFLERGKDAAKVLAETAAKIDPNNGDRLFGLYGARGQNGNLPVSSANGDYSTTGLDMFSVNRTKGLNPDLVRPLKFGETDAQFIATERNENPTLDDLTKAALNILGKDPDGFWVTIEGGDIDWAAHDNNIDNLIGATLDFDKAVGSVIAWINANGGWEENQLIVTADHDHYLTLNGDFPTLVRNNAANGISELTNIDDIAKSGNFWGTSATDKYEWGNHTNRPVPVYYQGPESKLLTDSIGTGYQSYGKPVQGIPGFISQVDIGETLIASAIDTVQKELVAGTTGNDKLFIGSGTNGVQDTIFTGSGNDEIDFSLNPNSRNNYVDGGVGNDAIFVSRNDRVFGSEGNDTFYAADGLGNNRMSGGAGDDIFFLGANDRALGGDGNDKFYARAGGNTISGGAGADQFWIASGAVPSTANTIVDFQVGTDVIGISKALGLTATSFTLAQVGANTAINLVGGGQTVALLTGIQATSLNTNQFVFG